MTYDNGAVVFTKEELKQDNRTLLFNMFLFLCDNNIIAGFNKHIHIIGFERQLTMERNRIKKGKKPLGIIL